MGEFSGLDYAPEFVSALENIASQLKWLGVGDATTPAMGAIEFLAVSIKEGSADIASALREIAAAIEQK
ncbi:hypothetical protein LCGC14_0522630 [marine sediment metagenome]|uniref:Uncharacterized protein n=1 Tax=marine sediment metagenome TaxID=412755 RepID=A0A0F9UJE7_9ZZZZ